MREGFPQTLCIEQGVVLSCRFAKWSCFRERVCARVLRAYDLYIVHLWQSIRIPISYYGNLRWLTGYGFLLPQVMVSLSGIHVPKWQHIEPITLHATFAADICTACNNYTQHKTFAKH